MVKIIVVISFPLLKGGSSHRVDVFVRSFVCSFCLYICTYIIFFSGKVPSKVIEGGEFESEVSSNINNY